GVNADGHREMLGVMEGGKEDAASWLAFLRHLKARGLKGVRLVTSDKCLGLLEALGECFPEAQWQRCIVHFYRNVFTVVPSIASGILRLLTTRIRTYGECAHHFGRYRAVGPGQGSGGDAQSDPCSGGPGGGAGQSGASGGQTGGHASEEGRGAAARGGGG